MSMCDVTDFLDYVVEHPPAHMILAAVHLKQKEKRGSREELMGLVKKAGGKVRTKSEPAAAAGCASTIKV